MWKTNSFNKTWEGFCSSSKVDLINISPSILEEPWGGVGKGGRHGERNAKAETQWRKPVLSVVV